MGNHLCHVQNGKIKCWGYNVYGELGLGHTYYIGDGPNEMGSYLPFVDVGNGLTVKSFSLGNFHTCVSLSNNSLKCFGYNEYGQLGLGDTSNRGDSIGEMGDNLPKINLGSSLTISSIVSGVNFNCVLFINSKVKCFGYNAYGQLGLGDTTDRGILSTQMGDSLPFLNFGTDGLISAIYSSPVASHACVVTTSTSMRCWGYNTFYQLGYGDTNNRGDNEGEMGNYLPDIDLGLIDSVSQIAIGKDFTCGLRTDKALICFGANDYGQLGVGSISAVSVMGNNLVATPYDSGKTITKIAAGEVHFCIVYSDLVTIKCVGYNKKGELGQGDTTNRGTTPSTLFSNIPAISLGTGTLLISSLMLSLETSCVIFIDNSLKCFGSGAYGILGTGNTNAIGDGSGEMESSLPFVDVFSTSTPTWSPTKSPNLPTSSPSSGPTNPTKNPSENPTSAPSRMPTSPPITLSPVRTNINTPTFTPTTGSPTAKIATKSPTKNPANHSTTRPSRTPTLKPTKPPQKSTKTPSRVPTSTPSNLPSFNPTPHPNRTPVVTPSMSPTSPTNRCAYSKAVLCKSDNYCFWNKFGKKKNCVPFDCLLLTNKKTCLKESSRCVWNKNEMVCNASKRADVGNT